MRTSERGIAIVWLLGLITVFGGLAALSIDILRIQAVLRQAQNAADAAALAGARQLDGKLGGWGRAKRSAVEIMRGQRIGGISSASLADLEFNDPSGAVDYFENELFSQSGDPEAARYRTSAAVLGSYRVVIERGTYWQGEFSSLEGTDGLSGQSLAPVANPLTYQSISGINEVPLRYDVPVHLLANAVRARVELSGIRAFFGKFVGLSEFSTMGRSAVAISDPDLNYPVAPLAVPACALLLETDGSASLSYQYETEEFSPEKQCIRESVFTEANPFAPFDPVEGVSPYDLRAKGIFRALSYPERATKRSLPIYGVMGLPLTAVLDSDSGEEEASEGIVKPAQIVSSFEKLSLEGLSSYSVRARLGDFFYPLENGVFPGGLLNPNFGFGEEASQHMRKILENQGARFSELFSDGGSTRAPNYPKLRTEDSDKDKYVKMGPDVTLRMKQFSAPNTPLNTPFNNPMCTDPQLRNIPLSERKAVEVNVMVISPTEKQSDGSPTRYCDYKAVFAGVEQDTTAPIGESKPRVVGFVRAKLFDFRLSPYDSSVSGPFGTGEDPASPNPAGVIMSGKYGEFMGKGKVFVEEHKEWRDCRRMAARCIGNPMPPGCPINCGGEPSRPRAPDGSLWSALAGSGCFDMPLWSALLDCVNNPSDLNYLFCKLQFAAGLAQGGFPQLPGVTNAGKACLPRKVPGCGPALEDNPACWEPPKPLEPQYGCGGVRARLSCEPARLTTPGSAEQRRPTLIQ